MNAMTIGEARDLADFIHRLKRVPVYILECEDGFFVSVAGPDGDDKVVEVIGD